jgi:hypothetical protein
MRGESHSEEDGEKNKRSPSMSRYVEMLLTGFGAEHRSLIV